ncbi:hypothetical protein D3C85_1510020 [compost metagenome]
MVRLLENRDLLRQILTLGILHILAFYEHFTLTLFNQPTDDGQQGAFPCSIGPNEGCNLAFGNLKRHLIDDTFITIFLGNVFHFYHDLFSFNRRYKK